MAVLEIDYFVAEAHELQRAPVCEWLLLRVFLAPMKVILVQSCSFVKVHTQSVRLVDGQVADQKQWTMSFVWQSILRTGFSRSLLRFSDHGRSRDRD